jgi:hypothetical protein
MHCLVALAGCVRCPPPSLLHRVLNLQAFQALPGLSHAFARHLLQAALIVVSLPAWWHL